MQNIVESAKGTGSHNTLVAAIVAAKLDGVLSGNDKLTVFAPTDAAFAKLPAGTVDALLKVRPRRCTSPAACPCPHRSSTVPLSRDCRTSPS
jgi:uncharacterized surface protein with fasciclin (FAS1) repeats